MDPNRERTAGETHEEIRKKGENKQEVMSTFKIKQETKLFHFSLVPKPNQVLLSPNQPVVLPKP